MQELFQCSVYANKREPIQVLVIFLNRVACELRLVRVRLQNQFPLKRLSGNSLCKRTRTNLGNLSKPLPCPFQQTLPALEAMPCISSGLRLRLAAQPRPRITCFIEIPPKFIKTTIRTHSANIKNLYQKTLKIYPKKLPKQFPKPHFWRSLQLPGAALDTHPEKGGLFPLLFSLKVSILGSKGDPKIV